VHLLRRWSDIHPDNDLYTWLGDEGEETERRTYGNLQARANTIAAALLTAWGCSQNDRAVLMYLPGLDFIEALWGCLLASVVAVPVYPVDLRKFKLSVGRFQGIVNSCTPTVALTHGAYRSMKRAMAIKTVLEPASWPTGLVFHTTDDLPTQGNTRVFSMPSSEDLALLQFTSCSTGDPKGVMLSHGNVVHNLHAIAVAFDLSSDDVAVRWLPQSHDMGLLGYFVLPALLGGRVVCMSPMTFLRKPGLWLHTISKYRGTYLSAPNFAFQRCVDKLADIRKKYPACEMHLEQLKGVPCRPVRLP